MVFQTEGRDFEILHALLILPYSVTVSTTDFDSVSHSSNLCRASKCCSLEKEILEIVIDDKSDLHNTKDFSSLYGRLAEWSNALVLKTRGCNRSVGSNPTSSS